MTDRSRPESEPETAAEPLVTLPKALRHELKDPMGPIETEAGPLLEAARGPLITVGDVVTYHVREAGTAPDVALVDGITKREAVDETVRETVTTGDTRAVSNPQGGISEPLVRALTTAIDDPDPVTLLVDGEEDLATLPAIVAAPDGASVVYGQPDEGMVHVVVDDEVRERVRSLLARFDGDVETLRSLLER